jgi:hypothetical protein
MRRPAIVIVSAEAGPPVPSLPPERRAEQVAKVMSKLLDDLVIDLETEGSHGTT